MAITLDATVGGASSNAYIDRTAADSILEENGRTDWAALTDAVKDAALIAATRELEKYKYKGDKTSETQALRWPRDGLYDRDGDEVASDAIPNELQYAVAELAYLFQSSNRFAEVGTEGFSKIKVASIELTIDKTTKAATVPSYIKGFISHWMIVQPFNANIGRV